MKATKGLGVLLLMVFAVNVETCLASLGRERRSNQQYRSPSYAPRRNATRAHFNRARRPSYGFGNSHHGIGQIYNAGNDRRLFPSANRLPYSSQYRAFPFGREDPFQPYVHRRPKYRTPINNTRRCVWNWPASSQALQVLERAIGASQNQSSVNLTLKAIQATSVSFYKHCKYDIFHITGNCVPDRHEVNVTFTLARADDCDWRTKCSCSAIQNATEIVCNTSGTVPYGTNEIVNFTVSCDGQEMTNQVESCANFHSLDEQPVCNTPRKRSSSLCKCVNGGCPQYRTRKEVATMTRCVRLSYDGTKYANQCVGNNETCRNRLVIQCFNAMDQACQSKYLKYIRVTAVRKNRITNLVEFNATVMKSPFSGADTELGSRTFRIRYDCFKNCRENDFTKVDVIKSGRNLVVFGNEPRKVCGETRYIYYLDEKSYIEATPGTRKCRKSIEKYDCSREKDFDKKRCIRKRICIHHEKLRKNVSRGCA